MGQYYCRIYKKSQQIISASDAVPTKTKCMVLSSSKVPYKATNNADNFWLITNCRSSALIGRNKLFMHLYLSKLLLPKVILILLRYQSALTIRKLLVRRLPYRWKFAAKGQSTSGKIPTNKCYPSFSFAIGAGIENVDISKDLSSTAITETRSALLDHLIIFFRDQDLSNPERHKLFTEYFCDFFIHPNFNLEQNNPEMVYLTRKPGDTAVQKGDGMQTLQWWKTLQWKLFCLLLKSLIGVAIPCLQTNIWRSKTFLWVWENY